jgi:hypothetical protein
LRGGCPCLSRLITACFKYSGGNSGGNFLEAFGELWGAEVSSGFVRFSLPNRMFVCDVNADRWRSHPPKLAQPAFKLYLNDCF